MDRSTSSSVKVNEYGFIIKKDSISNELLIKIKKDLTVKPFQAFGNFHVSSFRVFRETTSSIIVPVYYGKTLEIPFSVSFTDKTSKNHEAFKSCNIILRDNQIDCFNKCIIEKEKEFGGGIINLSTAMGKSVLALKIASFFSYKTIIVVNKKELIDQWKKEIHKFIPNARIGLIQGGVNDTENKDIVIAMLQSVSLKNSLSVSDFKTFNVCFIDECHNIGSEMFSKIMFKIRPRYIFGLTATLLRKDKLERIILWYIGNVIYTDDGNAGSKKQETNIYLYKYKGESSVEKVLRNGTVAVSQMLTNISKDKNRTLLISEVISELINSDTGRQILVCSDRISLLNEILLLVGKDLAGLFIGSMKKDDLELSKTKKVILGTYSIVSEGFNLPTLNCIIFATPRSTITQSIGRIYRKRHEITPIIVDIIDEFSIFIGQQYRRKRIYHEEIDKINFIYK